MSLNGYLSRQFGNPVGLGGRLVTAVMSRQNRSLYEETIRLLAVSDSDKVLDVGCGNGFVLNMLASRSQGSFAGIDSSKSMVRAAARRNRGFVQQGRMVFRHADAASLPFPSASFAKVFTINTVYFWADVDAVMAEARRVLQPGGSFVNALYTNEMLARFAHTQTGYRHHSPESLIQSAGEAGFAAEIVTVLDGTAYCLVCRATS